jgi:hypothetical protein
MPEHVERTLGDVIKEIASLEAQVSEKKKLANMLCRMTGAAPAFQDVESSASTIRVDEFYGRPLATAVEEVLVRRKRAGLGAATVAEIYESLKQGGFHFNTKNDDNAKRNLYSKLGKNPKFHRLPNGTTYGLTAWYPNIKKMRDSEDQQDDVEQTEESEEELKGRAVAETEFQNKTEPVVEVAGAKHKPLRKPRDVHEDTARAKAASADKPEEQMAARS